MDVDMAQKAQPLLLHNYYYHRETGHLVRDCLHYLNIQQLMVEQREKLIEDLIVLKNIVVKKKLESPVEEGFV